MIFNGKTLFLCSWLQALYILCTINEINTWWFTTNMLSGLLGSYLRWIQLITCLLLSRCYVTSSIIVEQMYTEMASRHRVCHHCIQIIKTATVPAKLCKRESTKQFHNSKIKFPLVFKKVRPPTRKLKTTYKASRPNLFV